MKPGFRLPIRISIDHEALAALDKRALAADDLTPDVHPAGARVLG